MQTGDRHEQLVAASIFQGQKLGGQAAGIDGFQPQIAADPVIQVYHRLTLGQLAEVADHRIRAQVLALLPLPFAADLAAQQFGLGDEHQLLLPRLSQQEAALERCHQQAVTGLAGDEGIQ